MPRKISEDQTRKQMIDPSIVKHSGRRPQLEQAGWYLRDHWKNRYSKNRMCFQSTINAIEWNKNFNDNFGVILMKSFSKVIADRGSSTTLPILKKSEFEDIVIPVPPLSLQEEFVPSATLRGSSTGVVARVESLRGRVHAAGGWVVP